MPHPIPEQDRTRTITHDGRTFTVAIDQKYSGMATGGLARIPVLFWTISTDGYPSYTGSRVTGVESEDFFRKLVAAEWPNMRKSADDA